MFVTGFVRYPYLRAVGPAVLFTLVTLLNQFEVHQSGEPPPTLMMQ